MLRCACRTRLRRPFPSLFSARAHKLVAKTPNNVSHDDKHILDFTKVQQYLDYLAETRNTVSLADIERRRPDRHSTPGTPQYASEYRALLENLLTSFSLKQLRQFVRLYGLPQPKDKGKQHYAMTIIEGQWEWPSLTLIEQRQRDWSNITEETFPLDVRESFLILGKDGADLLDLSTKYKVHITFSAHPMALKVEGLLGSINQLREHIAACKLDVSEEDIVLPTKHHVRPELLQRISRLTGAFLQDLDDGVIRASYKTSDSRSLDLAKRLVIRASCQVMDNDPVFAYVPSEHSVSSPTPNSMFPHHYALYPFLPTRPLPWSTNSGGTFRVRRVGEWFAFSGTENIDKTGGLAQNRGRVLNLEEQKCDIKDILRSALNLEPADSQFSTISASFGHILLFSPSISRSSILPPLKGSWPLSPIIKWMHDHSVRTVFNPSLPNTLLHSAPQRQQLLHRLVYRAVNSSQPPVTPTPQKMLHLELDLSSTPDLESRVTCSRVTETSFHLLLPDRPMDIRFKVSNSLPIAHHIPADLEGYLSRLKTYLHSANTTLEQPETPLLFRHDGTTYVLDSSSSVRQNVETVSEETTAISESVLDLEGNYKSTFCKVLCEDASSDLELENFLRACDRLSVHARES